MSITYITQSQKHQWKQPTTVLCLDALLFGYILVSVAAQAAEQQTEVTLSHLDRRLLVDAEQGNVWNANESPFLIGPEHDDGSSLWSLGRDVKVGKADTTQVGSQTNEDVPVRAKGVQIH